MARTRDTFPKGRPWLAARGAEPPAEKLRGGGAPPAHPSCSGHRDTRFCCLSTWYPFVYKMIPGCGVTPLPCARDEMLLVIFEGNFYKTDAEGNFFFAAVG